MRIYAGLHKEDWVRWGQFTTFKSNAPELLARNLKPGQRIYCSPLVDPYQPAEAEAQLMPRILEAVIRLPPSVFCLQTRGTLILRDVALLRRVAKVRVSFSITTDREDVRKLYEPHCATFEERLETVRALRAAGIETYATLAPLLPCDPENLARAAIEATGRDLVGDALHVRSVKPRGATTREAAFRIAQAQGHQDWLDPDFQASIIERIDQEARRAGLRFETGPQGFRRLAK